MPWRSKKSASWNRMPGLSAATTSTMYGSRLDCSAFGPVRYQTSFRPSSRSSRVSIASSLATASQEPSASAVTETSRPTVERRASTRLQPLSEMRRVTDNRGDCGCVVYALISRWFSLAGGRAVESVNSVFRGGATEAARNGRGQHTCRCFPAASKIDGSPRRPTPLHLHGSITALATPFTVAGEPDFDAWARLIDRQIAGGSRGIVVAGSTGEAATLLDGEYTALLRAAVDRGRGRLLVL